MEIWKDIVGYEGLYEVSSLGRIKCLERKVNTKGNSLRTVKERIRKPQIKQNGYHIVNLGNGKGKVTTFSVHQIVAQAFIPGFIKSTEINHIDGNPGNNNIKNLEISNPSHNQLHAISLGLKPKYGVTSKYYRVSYLKNPKAKNKWAVCINHQGKSSYGWKTFYTELEAAQYADKLLDLIGDTVRPRNFP
jgi:hypothetical protein